MKFGQRAASLISMKRKIITHEKRVEWLVSMIESSDVIVLTKTPNGYVVSTSQRKTRTCDSLLEALDEAIKDEGFF